MSRWSKYRHPIALPERDDAVTQRLESVAQKLEEVAEKLQESVANLAASQKEPHVQPNG